MNYPTDEPLLKESNRLAILPIKYHDMWKMYKNHLSVFWVTEEIDLSKDIVDWEKLTDNEQFFIKSVLAFFAGSDGIVMNNLVNRFANDVKVLEAKFFYSIQTLMEAVHNETYSLLIDTYIANKEEKIKLLEATEHIDCVKQKADWALKWIESADEFATRLVAFACVEGIFFSGSFCAIFWLKQRGLMPGLTTSNEFIARDEGLHTEFACLLYSNIQNKLSVEKVTSIVREAVEIEKHFITESIPCNMIGMNANLMKQYIEYVADRLLQQLGYDKLYKATNPFDFMERISLEGKDNFFEKRVSTYAKSGVGKTQEEMSFTLTSEF